MIAELDNAKIFMLSEKGYYGHIKILGENDNGIKVCYLAICRYDEDNAIYLFLCDEDMRVEQDIIFDCIDETVAYAQRRSQMPIIWNYPNTTL